MAKKSDFNTSRSVKDLQAEYGKMPPQAVDLEEAVLGALMLERDAFSIVGDLLEPDAFYKDAHQKIFRAIHKLFLNDDPVDLLTVSEALKQSGELEQVGGYYYLSQLTTRVASAAHIEFHAKIIVQKYLQRKLIGVCTELQEMAYDEATDVSDLMDKAQKAVFDIADGNIKKDTAEIAPIIDEAIKGIQAAAEKPDGISGLPSGFNALDAVTLALTYAEIPYDVVYDSEILDGCLKEYDWLHLHHEDFTGQMGKFYRNYRHMDWYKAEETTNKQTARKYGFSKISELKKAVVRTIRDYVSAGGFMFAMCSATDTFDIALAAMEVDICDVMFDGDPVEPGAQEKLDYSKTFAFKDFKLQLNPNIYEYSDIDVTDTRKVTERDDYFLLFEFSAKWDPVPTMLCQNHMNMIKGFMGQTTAYNRKLIKSNVLIMGENKAAGEVRYIHGEYGKGTWSFLGGHDPEDYQHFVGDPVTELDLHRQSAGYRLILNNILFPAARKKQHKT